MHLLVDLDERSLTPWTTSAASALSWRKVISLDSIVATPATMSVATSRWHCCTYLPPGRSRLKRAKSASLAVESQKNRCKSRSGQLKGFSQPWFWSCGSLKEAVECCGPRTLIRPNWLLLGTVFDLKRATISASCVHWSCIFKLT